MKQPLITIFAHLDRWNFIYVIVCRFSLPDFIENSPNGSVIRQLLQASQKKKGNEEDA